MRMLLVPRIEQEIAFARRAEAHFLAHPEHWSYADGEIEQGELFAMRWGADPAAAHAVLVIRVDDAFIVGDLDVGRGQRNFSALIGLAREETREEK